MEPFRSTRGGGVRAALAPAEASLLRSLVGQVITLIAPDGAPQRQLDDLLDWDAPTDQPETPDDPVLARLLPDGYTDDPEASAEFRRYTEESLRTAKVAAAQTVLASLPSVGGDVRLSEMECQQWLRALNDVRLALSVRLGITDENEDLSEQLAADDPRSAYIWVYQWLAYLQDSLIEALS